MRERRAEEDAGQKILLSEECLGQVLWKARCYTKKKPLHSEIIQNCRTGESRSHVRSIGMEPTEGTHGLLQKTKKGLASSESFGEYPAEQLNRRIQSHFRSIGIEPTEGTHRLLMEIYGYGRIGC
jgi:hypothetical protein